MMIDWNAFATPPKPVPGVMQRLSKAMYNPKNDHDLRCFLEAIDRWDAAYFDPQGDLFHSDVMRGVK